MHCSISCYRLLAGGLHGISPYSVNFIVWVRPALAGLLAVTLGAQEPPAFLRQDARAAEKKGDVVRAYLLYSQAAAVDPKDRESWLRALALRTRAIQAAGLTPSAAPEDWLEETVVAADPAEIAEARRALPPLRLHPDTAVRDFDLRGNSKALAEQVLKAYGIDAIFDGDYQAIPNLRFKMERADFQEATAALAAATQSFLVPVSERIALVARDNPQKRQELEHTIAIAVPLPDPVTVQEAQELARAVQQLMEIQKFGIDSTSRIAVFRDRVSKAVPAAAVFRDLVGRRAEVMIEVEFLEVSENFNQDLGIQWQSQTPLAWLSTTRLARSTPVSGFANLVAFGGGHSLLGVGIASTQLFATMSLGSARSLRHALIRSVDGQAATLHLGDKYPILTMGYFGAPSGVEGQAYTPPPQFNFEDIGVVLKMTPRVLEGSEVSIELEAEYKVLTGQALNGIPVIANRKVNSWVRLAPNQAAVVAGLVRSQEARTLTGLPGLATIPILGAVFRQDSRSRESGQTLLVIRPRILAPPVHDQTPGRLWTGTETRPRITL